MAEGTRILGTWTIEPSGGGTGTQGPAGPRGADAVLGLAQMTAGAFNINALAADNVVDTWSANGMLDAVFEVTGSRITCLAAGRVRLSVLLSFGGAVARYNGRVKIRQNGVDLPPRGKSGYIRNTSGHTEASLDIPCWWATAAVDDYFEVAVDREAASGTVNLVAGESIFMAEYHG